MSVQLDMAMLKYRESPSDSWHPAVLASSPNENIIISIGSFSSLPKTISNAFVTSNHVVASYELGTPSAQTSDWVVSTSSGEVRIRGTISGSTTMKLFLVPANVTS